MDEKLKNLKLSEEQLDEVAGGFIFNAENIIGSDPGKPWEVQDAKGKVLGRYTNRDEAIYNAGVNGVGFQELTWAEVQKRRGMV